ncbi:hypothetical protein EJ06DRAFT_507257 [Trichodelitschia bisporula]|uniref:Uncharacterized protein n=1 Tax=Trichodelitschia bisporula TaxID=703511 RepID=A0A6G1I359_9PEZI|nr:hypothetical protein EJ06DRAFT_507257 [Trichodelitschia bisporula]
MSGDLSEPIQARSLSSITTIASEPPTDPNARFAEPHGQLVLYIARVPGSKDIFLTPLKPRNKVVTAEDILSSLYYLHVHGPDNEFFLPPIGAAPRDIGEEEPFYGYTPASISRKQLPATPPRQTISRPLPALPRAPIGLDAQVYGTPGASSSSSHNLPVPRRRPVPSRDDPGQEENVRLSLFREHLDASNLSLPSVILRNSSNPAPTRITVIRRNPYSTEQWDVAEITDTPVFEISSDSKGTGYKQQRKQGQPFTVDVLTPGYLKFLSTGGSQYASPTSAPKELKFTRRVWMEGSIIDGRPGFHARGLSTGHELSSNSPSSRQDFRRSLGGPVEGAGIRTIGVEGDRRRSKHKGYTFLSPWDGRCEFSVSSVGSSLKACPAILGPNGSSLTMLQCKHSVPTAKFGAEFLPPLAVSELRFNLPGGGPLASATPLKRDKRNSYPSENVGLSLLLGQERAGGGFDGRQAKLGKLIIEEEGLKMIDLLVATNMGIWWRAYEKTA